MHQRVQTSWSYLLYHKCVECATLGGINILWPSIYAEWRRSNEHMSLSKITPVNRMGLVDLQPRPPSRIGSDK